VGQQPLACLFFVL